MSDTTKRYIFEQGAIYEETTTRYRVCLSNQALSSMRNSATMVTKELFADTTFATNDHGSWLVTEVDKFSLNTFWSGYEGPVFGEADQWPALKAVFRQEDGAIKKDITWTPPEYMKMWFGTNYNRHNELSCCYLMASMDGDIYRPPLPNVYSNGQICMGSHFTVTGDTMTEKHSNALTDFKNSEFNSDLDDGQCRYILINDDNLIHPSMEDYKIHLPMISQSKLAFMKEVV